MYHHYLANVSLPGPYSRARRLMPAKLYLLFRKMVPGLNVQHDGVPDQGPAPCPPSVFPAVHLQIEGHCPRTGLSQRRELGGGGWTLISAVCHCMV